MPTCFAHRPEVPTVSLLRAALLAAEGAVDDGSTAIPVLLSLRRGPGRDGVELAVLPLAAGTHPAEVLAGFTAPESWEAVGCVAAGTAHTVDDVNDLGPVELCPIGPHPAAPGAHTRVRFGFLLHRDGTSLASLWGGPQHSAREISEPPEGALADICRRVLRGPTPQADAGPEAWWAMVWLDRIFTEAVLNPAHRLSWCEVAALHPLAGAGDVLATAPAAGTHPSGRDFAGVISEIASTLTWAVIRSAVASGLDPVNQVDPDLAAWLDDGSFARTVMEPYLPVPFLVDELAGLLPERIHTQVTRALGAWSLA